jgi:hypothetical protein
MAVFWQVKNQLTEHLTIVIGKFCIDIFTKRPNRGINIFKKSKNGYWYSL